MKLENILGNPRNIQAEIIQLDEPFIEFASRFADLPGTVILMSGGNSDCARYHILAADPWLTFSGRNDDMQITAFGKHHCFKADPFDTLRQIIRHFHQDIPDLPVADGLFGYLAYDLKDRIEKLPRTCADDLHLPDILLFAPSYLVIHDKLENQTKQYGIVKGRIIIRPYSKVQNEGNFSGNPDGFKSAFTRESYMDAVKQIREYIAAGDIYQVNMSQRFQMDFSGHPFALFKCLYERNPAPFFAYINAGDHHIVSTSPERFILQQGKRVEARPIKGTRPRGKTPEEDQRLRQELAESKKDDAELSMIVDLLRNDIGKVCEAGSVRVSEHKRVEGYQNVYHLVSIVEGRLDADKDSVDLLKAAFPGGSITGCPKIRAMEIIDELEPVRRHLYTGSIGYISFHDTMDLSIVIRTAVILNGQIIFSVGGGVVYDSDPADEYEETLHKGKTLMEVFKGKSREHQRPIIPLKQYAWINGILKPVDEAAIPLTNQGFQFGYGIFETIRAVNGQAKFLEKHLERFQNSLFLTSHFSLLTQNFSWEDIISQVICKNNLQNTVAAVKIIFAKGDREKPPHNDILAVMARPYTHRLDGKAEKGLRLMTYPHPRQSPLADHKTLNYLYYFLAGKWAIQQGADEALILNPDGSVSESNSANILLIKDKTVIVPKSDHVLPGIAQNIAISTLSERGYEISHSVISPDALFSADEVILTNSLMGAVPVLYLNGKKLGLPSGLCQEMNKVIIL
ncbi:MAG: aminodeoxychorismate synthase, component I [Desulfobacteraceae bacterium IS3]|nr:MAG: aminodeoxychorismate synthase, component I [Desulfobacteraceae bacterium IS3]